MNASLPTWPRGLLFDLDGTLIHSAPDITAAVNELLGLSDLGPLSVGEVTAMIGNGVRRLVERAFAATSGPLSPDELDARYAVMMEIYGRHLTGLTTLIPGATHMLETFRARNVSLGIVTNKPQRFVEPVLDHFKLSGWFGVVIGGDAGVAKKPAPDMLVAAMARLGLAAADVAMVGDSRSDVDAARAAGVRVILLEGGYTSVPARQLGPDATIAELSELPAALEVLGSGG